MFKMNKTPKSLGWSPNHFSAFVESKEHAKAASAAAIPVSKKCNVRGLGSRRKRQLVRLRNHGARTPVAH